MIKTFKIIKKYSILCHVGLYSERSLDLVVKLENNPSFGYLWNCNLYHKLGSIRSNESCLIDLNLVPLQSGHLVIKKTKYQIKINT